MSLYEEIKSVDIVTPILQELETGELLVTKEGKLELGKLRLSSTNVPYVFTGKEDRHCRLWSKFYFHKYGIIPKPCFNCWKVVVKPRTFEELFKLMGLQQKLGLHAKCGIEMRPYNSYKGPYAGYFYGPMGVEEPYEEGLALLGLVRDTVADSVDRDIPVILKRACTEMENAGGPSDGWIYSKEQEKFEELLNSIFKIEAIDLYQAPFVINYIIRLWIEHGFRVGDKSIEKYVEKFPESFGITKTITYEEESKIVYP